MKTAYKTFLILLIFSLGLHYSKAQSTLFLKPFSSGLNQPTCLANAGDARLFVTEQTGTIRIIDTSGNVRQTPFLDITGEVTSTATEQGLLGLVFHPQFSSNGYFYVDYTGAGDSTRISRFTVSSSNPDSAIASSEYRILTIYKPYVNHNGGDLQFGPDGFLYIGTGDGGSEGDPENRAQDPLQLLGKMLRIDVNSGNPYAIPPTNPFYGQASVRNEIWALGLRNPWRFSFDRLNHDLWIADVGGSEFEEIDLQPASSTGGENWGWRCYEGFVPFDTTGCNSISNYSFPVFVYPHNAADPCDAVTGGYIYRGTMYAAMTGRYFFADYCTDKIWSLHDSSGTWTGQSEGRYTGNNFSTFGEDYHGEVYIAGRLSGKVFQLADTSVSGIENLQFSRGIGIRPNPASGKVTITFPSSDTKKHSLEIYDLQGRKLFRMVTDKDNAELDTGFLVPGLYFLYCPDDGLNLVAKLVRL